MTHENKVLQYINNENDFDQYIRISLSKSSFPKYMRELDSKGSMTIATAYKAKTILATFYTLEKWMEVNNENY